MADLGSREPNALIDVSCEGVRGGSGEERLHGGRRRKERKPKGEENHRAVSAAARVRIWIGARRPLTPALHEVLAQLFAKSLGVVRPRWLFRLTRGRCFLRPATLGHAFTYQIPGRS